MAKRNPDNSSAPAPKAAPGTIYGFKGIYNEDRNYVLREASYHMTDRYGGNNQSPIITEYVPVRRFRVKTAVEEVDNTPTPVKVAK